MTDKELKKLNRAELLELLLVQTKEVERLQVELEEARRQLDDRKMQLQEAGNLAQAALEVNHVMQAAQAAADQYLENIAAMEKATKRYCEKMIRDAAKEAEKISSDRRPR